MNGTLLAILSGVTNGIGGLAYPLGAKGKVQQVQLLLIMSLAGALLFGVYGSSQWSALSLPAILLGIAGGVTQYLTIALLRAAMKRGPMSPAWCAISLGGFIPVIVFSSIVLAEPLSRLQAFSLLCACAAILTASIGKKSSDSAVEKPTASRTLQYCLLLVALLLATGVLNIALKYATLLPSSVPGQTLQENQDRLIMFFVYVSMSVCSFLNLHLTHSWAFNRYACSAGAILLVGGVGTYVIILSILDLPAVLVFTLSNITSILIVAVGSVLFFRETVTLPRIFMVIFSILSIILNR